MLWNFRLFYQAYSDLNVILFPPERELAFTQIPYPAGTKSLQGFSPQLTWSHYRAPMRMDRIETRDLYECEAIECGWSKVRLKRLKAAGFSSAVVQRRG